MMFPTTGAKKTLSHLGPLLALIAVASCLQAQEFPTVLREVPAAGNPVVPAAGPGLLPEFDGGLLQVGSCASCGSSPLGSGLGRSTGGGMAAASMYDPVACGGSGCVPGSRNIYCSEHNSFASRMLTGIYECLAVPDPCYEPGWRPIMDVGMFTECARPVSQQRIRLGTQQHMTNITRNSYRIAPPPIGPTPISTSTPAYFTFSYMNIYEASIYTEIAAGNVAVTFDMPFCLTVIDQGLGGSGFGNMVVGTKSTVFDCELLQIGMSFKSSLPVGVTFRGLGNGLTSIEPGVLVGLKINEDTFLQMNFSEWVPFGGVPPYPGAMLIVAASLNRKIWQANPAVPLFAALEYSGYFFQSGGYVPYQTVENPPFATSSGSSYQQLGPSLRLFMTEKLDVGCGAQFALNPDQGSWGDQQYRFEFRYRY